MYPTIKRHPDGQAFANIDDAHAISVRRLLAQPSDKDEARYGKLADKPGSVAYVGNGIWYRRKPDGTPTAWLEEPTGLSLEAVRETCAFLKKYDEERDGLPWRAQSVAEWLYNRVEGAAVAP